MFIRNTVFKFFHHLKGQISFTNQSLSYLKHISNKNSCIRLSVSAGCEGFKYQFDSVKAPKQTDYIYQQSGKILLAVDSQSFQFVKGATIDYENKMIRSMIFVQQNPNAEASCSCKSSFSPKEVQKL